MKTIFNTTEKSNFILNMKYETLHKYVRNLLIICMVMPLISGAIWLLGDKNAYFPAAALSLCGFVSVLLFIVALLKKEVLFPKNISYILVAALGVLAAISSGFAFRRSVAVYGNTGRFEGLLAILSYIGIFLIATLVCQKKTVLVIFDVLIGAGVFQSIIAILQFIPALNFPSNFKDLNSAAIENIFLASGVTGSPIFLGTFLTLTSGIAIAGACYQKSTKRRIVYGLSALLFFTVSLFTSSIVPLIGIGAAFITICIIETVNILKNKGQSKKFIGSPIFTLIAFLLSCAIAFVLLFVFGGYAIYDRAIAYQDSFYNLFITGSNTIVNDTEFYPHNWSESFKISCQYWLLGTGPDCLFVPQMNGSSITSIPNSFDKAYNDFLQISATRGFISLGIYLVLLGISIKRCFGGVKAFFKNSEVWFSAAIISAIIGYLAAMFFGVSTILVAPFFWILLGLCNSKKLFAEQKS